MTTVDKERIEKEAEEAFSNGGRDNFLRKGYIAGATAEHKRLQGQLNYANNNIHALTESRNNLAERAQEELQAYRDIIKELLPLAENEIKMSTCIGYSYDKWKSTISKARKLIDTVTPTI